jgi:acyl-CoA thioesterase FadM
VATRQRWKIDDDSRIQSCTMHMLFRTLLHLLFLSRRRPDLAHYDIARTRFITLPTDLDINRHMNNGVYFSIMDVARFDLLVRSDVFRIMRQRRWYPVVVSETITFRKSLEPWQRFTIESRLLGFDEKAVYCEQRFVRPGANGEPEVYAKGFIRARFLRKEGGTVAVSELVEAFGAPPVSDELPDWIERWGADVALPATRAEAPSVWA